MTIVSDIKQHIDLEKVSASILEPGILENYVKPGVNIEPRDLWELKKSNMDLTGNKPYCVLVTSGHLSTISRSAREVAASKEFVRKTKAKALVVESLGHRIVGNFYMTMNKPEIKTKLFTDRASAIEWLRTQSTK